MNYTQEKVLGRDKKASAVTDAERVKGAIKATQLSKLQKRR
jgi:hypothetical protein